MSLLWLSVERLAYNHIEHIYIVSSYVRIHGHTVKHFRKKFSNKIVFSSSYIMQSLQLPHKMKRIWPGNVPRKKFSFSLTPFPCFLAIQDFNLCTWDAFIKFSDTSTSGISSCNSIHMTTFFLLPEIVFSFLDFTTHFSPSIQIKPSTRKCCITGSLFVIIHTQVCIHSSWVPWGE